MRKLLVSNSLSGVLQSFLNIILVFTVIPVFIKMLGVEQYGVFSLIITIGNLNLFTNLGLTSSLIKFLAEQGKVKESHYDIVVAFFITFIILLPITLSVAFFNRFILLKILRIPLSIFQDARIFFLFLLSSNFLIILGQVAKAILDSGQKIVITNFIQISYNFVYWGSTLLVLLLGYNLPQIGMASFVAALIWFISITYQALKYWGKLSFTGLSDNYKRIAQKQLSYGSKIYTSGLISFFYVPFSKILISYFIGIQEVGFFDIAVRIKNQLWGVFEKIFYPLYPLLSSIKDKKKLRLLVHDLEQKTFIFIIPLITIIIFVTKPFVTLWLGQNVDIISTSIIFIVTFFMIGVNVLPNYHFLIAKGHAEKTIILQVSNVFFNVLMFFITLKWFGYYAIIIGNVSAIISSFILSLYYQKKYLNSLIFDNWSQVMKLAVLASINIVVGYFLNITLNSDLLKLIFIPFFLALSTFIQYRYFKFFNMEDFERYMGKKFAQKRFFKFFLIKVK